MKILFTIAMLAQLATSAHAGDKQKIRQIYDHRGNHLGTSWTTQSGIMTYTTAYHKASGRVTRWIHRR
jgi:hypothetical protein